MRKIVAIAVVLSCMLNGCCKHHEAEKSEEFTPVNSTYVESVADRQAEDARIQDHRKYCPYPH